MVSGGASEQCINLILDITLGPENPQNGKQFCFHVNVRNISSEDLSGELNIKQFDAAFPFSIKRFFNHLNFITVDVNSVLYSHMYHGKKHKFVTQDIQNNQLIKAKSGKYFFQVQIWNHKTTIRAISGESFKVDVPFAMYNDKIADDQMSMKITSVVRINKTQKSFCDTLDFQMTNPSCVEIVVSRANCDQPKISSKSHLRNF